MALSGVLTDLPLPQQMIKFHRKRYAVQSLTFKKAVLHTSRPHLSRRLENVLSSLRKEILLVFTFVRCHSKVLLSARWEHIKKISKSKATKHQTFWVNLLLP